MEGMCIVHVMRMVDLVPINGEIQSINSGYSLENEFTELI